MYNKENLVALIYSDNDCYTQVVSLAEAQNAKGCRFTISPENGEWHREVHFHIVTKKIGERITTDSSCRYGVIGIYDHTKVDHLNRMVAHSNEATRNNSQISDD